MRRTDTDPGKVYYRSDSRLFRMNEEWFFASREGDQGPYRSEGEANLELERHIAGSQMLTPLKTKAMEKLEIPDIDELPVVCFESSEEDSQIEADPYLADISELDNTSLLEYRTRTH